MRLCYLTEESISFRGPLSRGGAIHVRNVVRGLRERGHEVTLLDWNTRRERPFHRPLRPRSRFVLDPLRTVRHAISVGRTTDVDAIVSKTRKTYLPGLVAARRLGVPHVVHVGSSLDARAGAGPIDRIDAAAVEYRLRAPHDGYLVVCETIAAQLRARNVAADRIHNVHNAVDTERFHPEADVERPAGLDRAIDDHGDLLVSYVGGLHEHKGLFDLAAAVERCAADVTVVLAGDGPARDELTEAFGSNAVFLGGIPYDRVPAVYLASDAFVLPSHTEGLPRVVLEAQATGTPVVATAVGGVPEVITDGETGRLVPARDPGALAGVLADLASDPAERERLRTNGRQAVAASFTWDALYDRYERALGSIVDRDRPTMGRAR